jgi:hypothetical protein
MTMTSHVLQDTIKAHEDFITAQPKEFRFILPLLRLLAGGAPVELMHLATVAHRPLEEIQGLLQSSDAEVDQAGSIVGWGLSLVPTPHQFHLGENILSTWCALDALAFPALLGRTAEARLPMPGDRTDRQPDRHANAHGVPGTGQRGRFGAGTGNRK